MFSNKCLSSLLTTLTYSKNLPIFFLTQFRSKPWHAFVWYTHYICFLFIGTPFTGS